MSASERQQTLDDAPPRHARRADGLVQMAGSYLAEGTPVENHPAESTRSPSSTDSAERWR